MVNRRADIYLENEDGNSEDYLTGDECPFDLTPDLIDIPGRRLRRVVCGRDGPPRTARTGKRGSHEARHVPLQEVSRHPLPRPLRHGLLRKRHPVPRASVAKGKGLEPVQEPRLGGASPPPSARSISRRIRAKAPCCMWTRSPPAPSPRRRSFRSERKRKPCGAWLPRQTKSSRLLQGGGFSRFILPPGKGTMSRRHGRQQYASGHSRRVRAGFHASPTAPTFSMLSRVNHAGSFAPSGRKILAPSAVKRPLFQRAAAVWTVHLFSSFLFISLFRSLPAIFSSRIPHRIQNSSEIRASPPPRRSA